MKFNKSRSKYFIEENDFTMADVLAHVKRWLNDKGYVEI